MPQAAQAVEGTFGHVLPGDGRGARVCPRLKRIFYAGDELDVVFEAAGGRHAVISIIEIRGPPGVLGQRRVETDFRAGVVIVEMFHAGKELDGLPDFRFVINFMLEPLGHAQGRKTVRVGAGFAFIHIGGAKFRGQRRVRGFDEIITSQRRDGEPVIDPGDGIVQRVQPEAVIKAGGDQVVVLGESAQRFRALDVVRPGGVLAIGPVAAEKKFIFRGLVRRAEIAGGQQGLGVAAGDRQTGNEADIPFGRRWRWLQRRSCNIGLGDARRRKAEDQTQSQGQRCGQFAAAASDSVDQVLHRLFWFVLTKMPAGNAPPGLGHASTAPSLETLRHLVRLPGSGQVFFMLLLFERF